ncbi:MAG TPA: ATP-binding protein [Thermodesulfovibrionales bacterium]|nr:ATP-binding protein [Thermodesulfovibrionales bacterium]
MINIFKKLFDNRTMGFKFTVAFVLVTLFPMLLLAYLSYIVIDSRLMNEAKEKIDMGIKTAWTEYYIRSDQMRYGMLQAASMEEIKKAVKENDAGYLKGVLTKWKVRRPYVDIWIVVDSRGNVLSRLNSDQINDSIEINGLVEKALTSGKSQTSTEILPEYLMDMEGEEFHRQFFPSRYPSGVEGTLERGMEGDEIALVVVTPVIDDSQRSIGAIITADLLNNDPFLPDSISKTFPWLSASISLDGFRITTNIRDANGRTAEGTLLPVPVISKVRGGNPTLDEWDYLGHEFISVFDPIRDNKGRVIGSLDVGMPKAHLWAIQKENLSVITLITFIGLALSLGVAVITTRQIIGPLKVLKEKADAFAAGKMDARIDVVGSHDTKDELKVLAAAFNTMTDEVKERYQEKERHIREVADKNRHLAELNEKFKNAHEELEVSYEEVQSQTEELNAANEELKIFNVELENKNAELCDANTEIMKEKDEQKLLMEKLTRTEKLSSLGELVSGVAHELNNPLTAVMGLSELLLGKDLPEAVKNQLKLINEASHRSKRIIDNLLTFARSHKLEKRYLDLNNLIRKTLELKEYQLQADNIDVELNFDPYLPLTMLDEHQLQQVFLNLINNSQHAIVKKGGRGRISVSTSSEGNIIRAQVSDTGKGIPDNIAKKIFDPFFTTKEVGSGTGLGLSISYGIIKAHEGNIYVTSNPEAGATFIIEFPILKMAVEASPASSAKVSHTQLAAKGRRALVLDDEHTILALLNEILSDAGFHVDVTATGDEALKMLKGRAYDLIISDLKMPGMNGKEFYHKVKSIKPDAANKIIFISGDTVSDGTQTFLKDTGNLFLKKPFTIEDLMKVISEHISAHA